MLLATYHPPLSQHGVGRVVRGGLGSDPPPSKSVKEKVVQEAKGEGSLKLGRSIQKKEDMETEDR